MSNYATELQASWPRGRARNKRMLEPLRVLALLLLAGLANAQDLEQGRRLYTVCAACHGKRAEGNRDLDAPKLAGHTKRYLQRQIEYFQQGIRGYYVYDVAGQQMALVALQLRDADAVSDIVAHILAQPDVPGATTVMGDIERGRELYEPCIECHGVDAGGDEILSSPGLARLDDWYIVSQLAAFANRHRGAHDKDAYGSKMAPVLGVLEDERNRSDLAAFLVSLR